MYELTIGHFSEHLDNIYPFKRELILLYGLHLSCLISTTKEQETELERLHGEKEGLHEEEDRLHGEEEEGLHGEEDRRHGGRTAWGGGKTA